MYLAPEEENADGTHTIKRHAAVYERKTSADNVDENPIDRLCTVVDSLYEVSMVCPDLIRLHE